MHPRLFSRTTRTFVLALAFLTIVGSLKWWCDHASPQALAFLLRPVAGIISGYTGEPGLFVPDEGYVFHGLRIIIDRSCSGASFLLITWTTFSFLVLRRSGFRRIAPLAMIIAGLSAYVLTLLANSARILFMVHAHRAGAVFGPKQHEALGAFIFIITLLATSLFLDRSLQRRTTHAHLP